MQRVYIIGMSKTDSQRKRIEKIGKQFEAKGFETYMPHQHLKEKAKMSKKNYYAKKRNIIRNSCMVVADVSSQSMLLWEDLEKANAYKIPIILLYRKGSNIDNAIIEMESVKCLMQYDTEEALVERIRYYMKDFILRMI